MPQNAYNEGSLKLGQSSLQRDVPPRAVEGLFVCKDDSAGGEEVAQERIGVAEYIGVAESIDVARRIGCVVAKRRLLWVEETGCRLMRKCEHWRVGKCGGRRVMM